tara:strand:+ start:208 stop:417 length:210 start_codon:yes stop_codon:yes gene_type:complete
MNYKERLSPAYFFYKSILRKVSFDTNLFGKELKKAILVLSKYEGILLYNWALTFSKSQPELHLSLDFMD